MKVIALTSVSGPYIVARWSAFATKLSGRFALIEFGRISGTYQWQPLDLEVPYQRIILSERSAESQSPFNLIRLLIKELNRIEPDILVLNGYAQPATLSALVWSLLYRKRAILLSESKEDDAPRSWGLEIVKRLIIKGYNAALVAGQPHKRYLTKLGITPDAIFLGYDVVGNDAFNPNQIRLLPKTLDRPYFLAINRFVPKKNLLYLISSYAGYRQKAGSHSWDLVLCGDGSLRPQIEQRITELSLQDFVHLPGFLQQDELLPYFAHASCFIHASIQEQWGLVVNEAMAAGLPVLVSNRCGCFEDLILEGVNGFGFDPENRQQLTDLMLTLTSGDVDLDKMGNAAFEHIQNFSPEHFAQGLVQAVEYALAHS